MGRAEPARPLPLRRPRRACAEGGQAPGRRDRGHRHDRRPVRAPALDRERDREAGQPGPCPSCGSTDRHGPTGRRSVGRHEPCVRATTSPTNSGSSMVTTDARLRRRGPRGIQRVRADERGGHGHEAVPFRREETRRGERPRLLRCPLLRAVAGRWVSCDPAPSAEISTRTSTPGTTRQAGATRTAGRAGARRRQHRSRRGRRHGSRGPRRGPLDEDWALPQIPEDQPVRRLPPRRRRSDGRGLLGMLLGLPDERTRQAARRPPSPPPPPPPVITGRSSATTAWATSSRTTNTCTGPHLSARPDLARSRSRSSPRPMPDGPGPRRARPTRCFRARAHARGARPARPREARPRPSATGGSGPSSWEPWAAS